MDAQLNQEIVSALEAEGYSVEHGDAFLIRFPIGETSVTLELQNAAVFPYEIPLFRLTDECFEQFKGLPHVSPNGGICAFDLAEAVANPYNPVALFLEALNKNRRVLQDGKAALNAEDYFDEFTAYWTYDDYFAGVVYNLANLDDSPRELIAVPFNFIKHTYVIGEAIEDLKNYGSSDDSLDCLYAPFAKPLRFPFPSTKTEWERIFEANGILKHYRRFIRKHKGEPSIILISQPHGQGKVAAALLNNAGIFLAKEWMSELSSMSIYASHLLSGQEQRERLCSLSKIWNEHLKKNFTARLHVEDIRGVRLTSRGGIGNYCCISKAAIIGCGSLGSLLADALAKSGIEQLRLVDKDKLEPGNVARHLCGLRFIGKSKPDAIKEYLGENMPSCVCDAISEDAHNVLDESPEQYIGDESQALFLATGTLSIELHALRLFSEGIIDTPIISLWVEPYGLAGHALVFNKPQNLCPELFDESLRFKKTIVQNSDELSKRESGCISTYVPYSGSDAQIFVNTFLRVYFERMVDSDCNYHFSWFGNISAAHKYGATICEEAIQRVDYSHEVEKI
jgi:hypothetical protein